MLKARLHFDGDNVWIEKLAREYSLTQDVEDKLNSIPEVIDNVTTDSGTDALSARMGMRLQEQIDNLASRGRFLSVWDAETWLPETDPLESPYVYRAWDYYLVGNVSSGTNYRPHGSSYTSWVASQTVEPENISANDLYIYDGTQWGLQWSGWTQSITWWSISWTLSNQTDLQNALDEKLNFWDNLAFNDTTTVLVGRWVHSPGWDSCGHWVTIDPKGEVFTHNATTGWYNEATLWNWEIEILHSVSSTSTDYTVTIDHEKLTANDWINTQIYSFLWSNRIATLNDITAHTIPELHTSDVYYDLITTTPGTYKLVDSWKYLGYTYMIPSGVWYVEKPAWWNFTTGWNWILYFKWEVDWTYIEWWTIIRSDMRYVQGWTWSNGYEFLRLAPMAWFSAPVGPYRWQLWYDISADKLKVYDDSNNWVLVDTDEVVVSTTAPSNPTLWLLWYDSTNNVLKAYDWTNWNACWGWSAYSAWNWININANNEISVDTTVVATQTDLSSKADAADIELKVFTLSSTSDVTTWAEIVAWCNSWKIAVIKYWDDCYYLDSIFRWEYTFKCPPSLTAANTSLFTITIVDNSWTITISGPTASWYTPVTTTWDHSLFGRIDFTNYSPTVPSKTAAATNTGNALATEAQVYLKADASDVLTKNNTTSYTPSWDYNPATKKYVDDSISWIVIPTYTAWNGIDIDANNEISVDTTDLNWNGLDVDSNWKLAVDVTDFVDTTKYLSVDNNWMVWVDVDSLWLGLAWNGLNYDSTYDNLNIDPTSFVDTTKYLSVDNNWLIWVDNSSLWLSFAWNWLNYNSTYTNLEVDTSALITSGWYLDTDSNGYLEVDKDSLWLALAWTWLDYNSNTWVIDVDTTVVATQTDIANFFDKTSDDADDIDDTNSTNKFVTDTEKNTWNWKQDAIQDLSTIRSNAAAWAWAATTISWYGDIVTHDANEFATAAQWAKADTALQSGDDVSELVNDAGYITNAVNDLANYYKKTETYTQAEINSLISNFGWFEVVSTLPVSDIKTNIIYLLWPTWTGADKYEEYIYYNSTWTKIWDTSVDLTNYFNTSTQTSDAITQWSTNLFLTSAERTKLWNTSGVNTWDQSASDFDIKDLTDSTWLRTAWSWKQDALTAWTNIQIDTSTNTISATDTTYTEWEWIEILNMRDYSALQWPAPDGFHVPLNTEWQAIYNIWTALWGWSNDWANFGIALKLPFAGGRSNSSASVTGQGSRGFYWSSSRYDASNAYSPYFYSSYIFRQGYSYRSLAYSVRCFKNEPVIPTASWALLYAGTWDGWIFWSPEDWLISLSSDLQTWITIADKNLWATTVWNSWDTLSEANCGKYYQRWNNYGFAWTWTLADTSTTQVDASTYWPWNYYSSSTFIKYEWAWDTTDNWNLWWWETWVVTLENAITNTGVLSVNWQTGDVTIQTGWTYTAWDWIDIDANNEISVDSAYMSWYIPRSSGIYPDNLANSVLYYGEYLNWWVTTSLGLASDQVGVRTDIDQQNRNRAYLEYYNWAVDLYLSDTVSGANTTAIYKSTGIESTAGWTTETFEFQWTWNDKIARLKDVPSYTAWNWISIDANDEISNTLPWAIKSSTAPSNPSQWDQRYDTTNDELKIYDGTNWNEVWGWSWDMLYADFNWASKTWATVTLDLNSTITPSANFTVNAPSTIKDWQMYVLRVTQWATVYTMTLWTNVTNPYGESLTMSAYTVNQFSFLAVGWNLELQPSVTVWESWAKIFYANTGDTWHEISDIWGELETWLNATGQTDGYDTFKDAVLVYDWVTYNRRNTFYTDSGYKYIYFISRNPNVQNNNNWTSKWYYSLVRFKFSYSSWWSYESDYSTSYITTTTQSFLRTDFDYSTPYTPLYNGSPATKAYVDTRISSIPTYTSWNWINIDPDTNEISANVYPAQQPWTAGTIKIWLGSQTDYDNLSSYDSWTLYFTTSS